MQDIDDVLKLARIDAAKRIAIVIRHDLDGMDSLHSFSGRMLFSVLGFEEREPDLSTHLFREEAESLLRIAQKENVLIRDMFRLCQF